MGNQLSVFLYVGAGLGIAVFGGATGLVLLLRRISGSVGLAPPTEDMKKEEDAAKNCALFRHLPGLASKLAWRSLGATATPVHLCTIDDNATGEKKVRFWVKREDLVHNEYGGNKVRTLQHQLAVCESRREAGEKAFRQLVSLGSGGSNQVVATTVHARKLGWDGKACDVNACWFDKDEPDLDNALNMLSVLSFPNVGFTHDWGAPKLTFGFFHALKNAWQQKEFVPMMLGGNCPSGVLGQAGGVLELAEQIVAGESPDPTRLYVPVGSGCTVSGLVLGTVLARHLGLEALSSPGFRIVGCNVHDGFATGDRALGLHVNPFFRFLPLTITHSVLGACAAIQQLGGPDLEKEAMDFIQNHVDLRADAKVVGRYGGHSELSREAARLYDDKGTVTDYKSGKEAKNLWVCGHFVAKAFQPLVEDLKEMEESDDPTYMLWMTKSAVQPRGSVDEWSRFMDRSDAVKEWAEKGKAESVLRPGKVSTKDGKPEDYRSIMTKVA